jgi:hypothetical protein
MARISSMPRQLRFLSLFAILGMAGLGLSTACGPLRHAEGEEEAEMRAEIEFINESLYPAEVYAVVAGSESIRIGSVMAGRREILRVPQQMVDRASSLSIVARPLAQSRSLSTGPISIGRGERLQVRMPINGSVLSVLPSTR